jgi:ABC-type sulfate/molybdate transport systems ATPase subunit
MPGIELKGIRNYVFSNLDMKIFDEELLVVLGPNGAGKTTLLNIIAGLTDYEGTVLFDGIPIDKIPTNERGIGYLFQNLALFHHLDVVSNVGYSLRIRGKKKEEIAQKVDELLKLMKIEHLKQKHPKNLSSGEKQRVALARALATSPKVLLLDEPFNSLDIGMCKCLREEIHQIQRRLGITTVFVTHNLADAEEMGDRIMVLNRGRIQQVTSKEIFFPQSVGDKGNSSRIQDVGRCPKGNLDASKMHRSQLCLHCTIDCYCKRKEEDYEGADSPTY